MDARSAMLIAWLQQDDELVAGAICTNSECEALVVSHGAPERLGRDGTKRWEFVCDECATYFSAIESGVVFHSVPKRWLLAGVQAA
jgi:hypothetical protein